jgi:hypothetical protein
VRHEGDDGLPPIAESSGYDEDADTFVSGDPGDSGDGLSVLRLTVEAAFAGDNERGAAQAFAEVRGFGDDFDPRLDLGAEEGDEARAEATGAA